MWLDALSSVLQRVPVLNGDEARGSPGVLPFSMGASRASRKGLLLPGPGRQHARFPHSQRGRGPGGLRTKPIDGAVMLVEYGATAPCARSKSWTASRCSCNPMTGSTTRNHGDLRRDFPGPARAAGDQPVKNGALDAHAFWSGLDMSRKPVLASAEQAFFNVALIKYVTHYDTFSLVLQVSVDYNNFNGCCFCSISWDFNN